MANNDASSYVVRFNEITQTLEYAVNGSWVTVPVPAPPAGSITVAAIDSGAATIGQVLTADGAGGATFEDLP